MGKMTHIQMAVGEKQQMTQDVSCRTDEVRGDKFPSPWSRDERLYAKHKKSTGGGGGGSSAAVVEKTGKTPGKRIEPVREVKFRNRKGIDNWLYSSRSKVEKNSTRNGNGSVVYEKEMKFKKSDKEKDDAVLSSKSGAQVLNKRPKKQKGDNTVVDGKKEKKSKKSKVESAEVKLRIALDTCSKKGDVMGAIALYDSAIREGTMMGQYHYNVVLYLCSSAAVGVVQPAKSGSSSQNNSGQKLDKPNFSNDGSSDIKLPSTKDFNSMGSSLQLSGDSLASLAKDLEGNGGKRELDYQFSNESPAYHAESKMKFFDLEVSSNGYQVETGKSDGRLDTGVGNYVNNVNGNEETGIRVSKGIKRYALTRGFEIFEKMRSDNIPLSEAALTSMARIAMSVDNGDMAFEMVKQMNALGIRPRLRSYGPALFTFCYKGEVEKAFEVEKHMLSSGVHPEEPELEALLNKWLDYYGHFEAVVDAANVGLSTQRRFSLSKVNSVVNGIRQKLPSKKFPLIVVHHRRISGGKMEEPTNKKLLEKWRNADALYATPTGSNDDWYWLYAAIKFKCLIVTNDEMRDHNFQLLGNDFFPKWKERHQVHFSFTEHGPEFHMPPPCSVVIQESVKGHWHVPICVKEQESNRERTWLCVTRGILPFKLQGSSSRANAGQLPQLHRTTSMSTDPQCKDDLTSSSSVWTSTRKPQQIMQSIPRKIYRYPGKRVLTSSISTNQTLISKIKEAEKQAGCVMDFQI
ncbi:uncharacterized protein [Aristolochia californica]|uniref:uncharacterized protein isoform X4 n=1 Tax=Aristolochia californica TaxID=171875 RepID=UPI0035DBA098